MRIGFPRSVGKQARQRAVAYKTVDTFGGICRRRLWLKDSGNGDVSTDGHAIQVPFNDPDFYRLTEHALAHILFESDSLARKKFLEEYVSKVDQVTKKAGVSVNIEGFAKMMSSMINILEDHRINTLWGLIYPGSFVHQNRMVREDAEKLKEKAKHSLLAYLFCLRAEVDVDDSPFVKYKPFLLESLRKVERRGFGATLLSTKWLVTQLVSELVRESTGQSSPQAPDATNQYRPSASGMAGIITSGMSGGGGSNQQQGGGSDGSGDGGDADDSADGAGGSGQSDEEWYPPPASGDLQTRSNALDDLEKMADSGGHDDGLDDWQDPQFPSKQELKNAANVADEVTNLDANDKDRVDGFMGGSQAQMQKIIDAARNAMRQQMHEDDWVRKDAMAKVVFTDVTKADIDTTVDILPEDRDAIRRLRAQFFRVMGRTKTSLAEAGSEIDIQAYIQARAAGVQAECFKHEVRGQGFKSVILMDRSGSMSGNKTVQAERACRIISRATRFPFVDMNVWGFKSMDSGQVDIDRFDRMMDSYTTKRSHVGGVTPLHVAVRLGVRFLEGGQEAKQLFVITDGFPIYQRRDGRSFPTWQLMMYVREEVLRARKHGIGVSCIFIGHGYGGSTSFDVTPKQMNFMFGQQKYWKMIDPTRIGSDLVHLVSTSFVDYLRNA